MSSAVRDAVSGFGRTMRGGGADPRRAGRAMPFAVGGLALALGGGFFAFAFLAHRDAPPRELLDEYCVQCHNATDWDGGIAFDLTGPEAAVRSLDPDEDEAEIWEKAVRKVKAGFMPPSGADRPERAALEAFAATLETRLDRAWAEHPDPGAEPLSRLNRAEYANAVRDLLAFDAGDIVSTLPTDESVGGFDNIGDGLSVSPTLIEGYVSAATAIGRRAVGDRSTSPTQVRYEAAGGSSQDRHIDGLPLGTRGGLRFTHDFPLDATYEIRVVTQGPGGVARQTFCEPPSTTVALNGVPLDVADPSRFRLPVPAGPQTIAVALVDRQRCAGVNELYDVYGLRGGVRHVEIHGPYDATGPGETPSRRAIFSCYPRTHDEETLCALEIMTRLATKAYRRPVDENDAEMETLMQFYRLGRAGGDFETGMQHAISRLLMSPQFVFQFEHEPEDVAPGEPFRISDIELASRLSFFLWSSLPDAELVELGTRRRLSDPEVLERQARRMLRDVRSHALVENFAGQWLSLRELANALPQDPDFDANLRAALQRETELLVASIIAEDRSVLDLIDADYTFLNERLAQHYGIPGVRGSYMRRVALDETSPRRGLLGHGSWLTVTSVADRTSPVIRGEWIVTHLLGAPVPEPPPGVEADLSDEAEVAREGDTLRERLERHRSNATCAACHQIMDPLGLALENFDLVGRWRDVENGKPVDTSVELIDGTRIAGPGDIRRTLVSRPDLFVTALTEHLLTYAVGRVVDYGDMPAVREIVRRAEGHDYSFSSIVLGIVASEPFQKRVKTTDVGEVETADVEG